MELTPNPTEITYAPGCGPTPADHPAIPRPIVGDVVRFSTWAGTSLLGTVYSVSNIVNTICDDGLLYGVETADGNCFDVRNIDIMHVAIKAGV